MHFQRNIGKLLIYEFFYLEDIDLGTPNLHVIEIFSHTISHKNLAILAFIAAELAVGGGRFCPPPIPGRVILNPIARRGLCPANRRSKKMTCKLFSSLLIRTKEEGGADFTLPHVFL